MQNLYAALLLYILVLAQRNIEAGPAIRRTIREIYPDIESAEHEVCIVGDVVYGVMEPVPADQPCLKCRCRPPGVQCETIRCIKKPGCKAIHKPNSCCPEYQCECEYDGRIYANGERLETSPGGECKVCYCRGGEIQCAEVSCYIRTDCEAKAVPGQCCPKYDHCPPKGPSFNQTITKEVLNLVPIAELINSTDESNKIDTTTDKPVYEHSKITIQEIIPEFKEIPITVPALNESNQLEKENDVQDSEPEQSEITEIVHPPSVLRIGDKLLYLKKGELIPTTDASTPNSVITIIGAEGLQQGYEDSSETHETELKTADSTHILSLVKRKYTTTEATTTSTTTTTPTTTTLTTTPTTTTLTATPTTSPTPTPTPTEVATTELIKTENATAETDGPGNENLTARILPQVLDIRNNKTVPQNISNSEWLKSESASNESAETEAPSTTEIASAESLEDAADDDSGETTTPKTSGSITAVTQDASVETLTTTLDEASDMMKNTALIDDVEIVTTNDTGNTEATTNPTVADVETINLDLITRKPEKQVEIDEAANNETTSITNDETTTSITNEGTTYTKSDETTTLEESDEVTTETVKELPAKKVLKRAPSNQDEADEVFKQLEDEINAELTERTLTKEEEEAEAKKIFLELMEESSTPQSAQTKPKSKESEMLQKVSNALARLTLRGGKNGIDTSILGILGDFFSSQYKYYSGRE